LTSPSKFGLPLPSVFTPFLRRFTDERARDLKETVALYETVTARYKETIWAEEESPRRFARVIIDRLSVEVPVLIEDQVRTCLTAILELEKPIFSTPEVNPATDNLSLKEMVDLRRFLRAQEHFLDHEDKTLDALGDPLVRIFSGLIQELPRLDAPSPFTIPLVHLFPGPLEVLEKIGGTLTEDVFWDLGVFIELNEQRYKNLCDVNGVVPNTEHKKPLKTARDSDLSPQEATKAFLRGTPFFDFLMTPVPLKFDYETRFSHVHVIGGSGSGKTQLLQNLILHDLESEEPPALIIVDSQNDLISKLSHLEIFSPSTGTLDHKLTIISPRDIDAPPAINIFDLNRGRLDRYSPQMREQVVAGVIQTFDYLFTGLLGADLTAKQSVFFRFVARLMLVIPETMGRNATILDMMNLMDDPGPYREAIKTLPQIPRNFFERDFQATSFRQTKEQIRYRLQAILENPTLARLFTSERTKVDLFTEMNNGGIILIDTAKDFLKDGSAHFGRLFISLVLQAALERASIPEQKRRPAFLIVDEAADYFDDNIDDLLTQVRKYKLGCLFAHQFLDQCSSSLRASLAANTASKFCAGLSVGDARTMAAELRTTPENILKQKKLTFSCFVRNVTPEAVSVPVKAGNLESKSRMSASDYAALRDWNKKKTSTAFDEPAAASKDFAQFRHNGDENTATSGAQRPEAQTPSSAQPKPSPDKTNVASSSHAKIDSTDSDEPTSDW
jgi:hypothetical protein